MNLKDAFHLQNKLQDLQNEATDILSNHRNVVTIQNTYLRKKVIPEAEDEVVLVEPPSDYADHINEVVSFLLFLLEERTKLSEAIHEAKAKLPIDMDNEVNLNHQRQELSRVFRGMIALRSSEKIISRGGEGYRFNADGNQISYRCDLKQVTTINFDRKKLRHWAAQLDQKSNKISTAIDCCLVNSTVEYTAPFDVNASFDEILQDYITTKSSKFQYEL